MNIGPNDIVELAFFEIWKRIIDPVDDNIPDPEVNFEACVIAMADRVEATVYALPSCERHDYVMERAREALRWCKDHHAPDPLTAKIKRWLAKLQQTPSASALAPE